MDVWYVHTSKITPDAWRCHHGLELIASLTGQLTMCATLSNSADDMSAQHMSMVVGQNAASGHAYHMRASQSSAEH